MFKYDCSWHLACSQAGAQHPLGGEAWTYSKWAVSDVLWPLGLPKGSLSRTFDVFLLPEGLSVEGLTMLKLAGSESRSWEHHKKAGSLHGSFGKLPQSK